MNPLADRMRPTDWDDFAGQKHLIGPDAPLRKLVKSNNIPSMILWGPPGVGKTSLAQFLAHKLNRPYHILSAINSGVKDVRNVIDKAQKQRFFDSPNPILFIDEIHRFSKAQQDSLLSAVERGIITLIGATTENPSFEVISALLSRCQVFSMKPLSKEDLEKLIEKAISEDEILKKRKIKTESTDLLIQFSGGDARKLFNALEITVNSQEDGMVIIDDASVREAIQENLAIYDKGGEMHYDIISAFIKSIRGSDPNGAVYWLARMIEGGENEKFICRRMIISAAEDIGLANPNALLLANACMDAVHKIGFPEARIIMSQTAIYLATSPKSNSAYLAINKAQASVRENINLPVPLHLRNAPTSLMKEMDYGKDYKYSHDYAGAFTEQEYLPEAISGTAFYQPSGENEEKYVRFLRALWREKYGY